MKIRKEYLIFKPNSLKEAFGLHKNLLKCGYKQISSDSISWIYVKKNYVMNKKIEVIKPRTSANFCHCN